MAVAYAQRVLLPRGIAVLATERARARAAHERTRRESQAENERQVATEALAGVKGKTLVLPVKASGSKLYGSVGVPEIITAAKTRLGVALNPSWIVLERPLTVLGDHPIVVRAANLPSVTLTLTLSAA